MIITLGCDHAGFPLKSKLMEHLHSKGHQVIDHGSYTPEPVDFPDIAKKVCSSIKHGESERGIMVCGTGVGASIAANKIPEIRAALCHDIHSAHQCVEHDNVNVMCLGAKIIGEWLAYDLIDAFLNAEFSTEPEFRRRVEKLNLMELEAEKELKEK
ncbi:ribose 5-phosphate isomerase B [Pullulanibacillus pueri]|uniref:Ribose-5-phosphate isomerase n=1 Tax=Pullulanibacillus pueri TaxID=1437324 RepID=A0A8J2ZZ26_9BACL|nr:ribose 5-phosphate isomerase B [Pullulanibacillus pueri]MBM7683552.1 ribose 5-phosphate isomerase B [Pullulanibacillus pueri]GGH86839.1 ribose-5-phosphate isomerase [Pullulanibacillus pueri]